MASVSFQEGLTSIENEAFYGATSLASVSFPESLTSIDAYAFYNATSLASVSFPESLTSIGHSRLLAAPPPWRRSPSKRASPPSRPRPSTAPPPWRRSPFPRASPPSTHAFTTPPPWRRSPSPRVSPPSANSAFSDATSLASVSFPESLTSIGNSAFLGRDLLGVGCLPREPQLHRHLRLQWRHLLGVGLLPRGPHLHRQKGFPGTPSSPRQTSRCRHLSARRRAPLVLLQLCIGYTDLVLPEGTTSIDFRRDLDFDFRNCYSLLSVCPARAASPPSTATPLMAPPPWRRSPFPRASPPSAGGAFRGATSLASALLSQEPHFHRLATPSRAPAPPWRRSPFPRASPPSAIRDYAFEGATSLASVSFSEGLTSIGFNSLLRRHLLGVGLLPQEPHFHLATAPSRAPPPWRRSPFPRASPP